MRDRLEEFYEHELYYIRRMAAEFSRDRPKIADRLDLGNEARESADPHVERLIESFAFLTARVRLKMEDEFPELTDSLLGLLYPHYLNPIPSLSIAQFLLDPSQGKLTDGFTIPRQSRLISRDVQGIPCRFRTTYPVTLWPLELTTTYLTAPFGSGIRLPAGFAHVEAMLRLELRIEGNTPWKSLSLDQLRVCLNGDERTTHQLYELIFNHCEGVFLRDGSGAGRMLPADSIREVGFGLDEGLLPYDPRSFIGYRLLTEYFAFPQKFLFADLTDLHPVVANATGQKIDICLLLNKADRTLESRVDPNILRLGCSPIVNLFSHHADPIRLTQTQTEYHVIPDVRHRRAFEVYSIDSVTSTNVDNSATTEYQPFFACRHGRTTDLNPTYWHSKRTPSTVKNDRGTEMWLSLVDLGFNPSRPAAEVLSIALTCSNRDLPGELRTSGGESWGFQLEGQAPIKRIDPIVPPTLPCRIPDGELRWRLISHLSLNHFSISDGESGADALRELLKLYDYNNTRATSQQIAGISSISSRRKTARIAGGGAVGFCRGIELDMTFDPEKYPGVGAFLMASVLDKFVGLYASINSFTRLSTRMKNAPEPFKIWPYRVGDQTIL
ncbi:type VI secretion system baseplate subunit TssF [Schlesneria paludicola]|uniref:type VI secretion system baseplate subunit TssF n=1 Tax=Schlesneria paludicola TaxID=360056 RepID=UPI00029A53D3|nr:type VI secretion system baseplate subunit TssF [Schlesneria paludicola]